MKTSVKITLAWLLTFALLFSAGGAAFAADLNLPSSLTTIEAEAFRGDSSLDNVVLPGGVKEIKSAAFADSSLQSIHIPASVTSVASDAFSGTSPVFWLESLNTFSRTRSEQGTVHLTRSMTLSNSLSFTNATLIVDAGVTLTVSGSLQAASLIIRGSVVNGGTLRVTKSVGTEGAGVLSVASDSAATEIPSASFYNGLHVLTEGGSQITLTSATGNKTVTPISVGETAAEISYGGKVVSFCFVPAVTGSYTLTSTSGKDTYASLLDASGGLLDSDDDSGSGYNFKITHTLTARTPYYFDVKFYYGDVTGTIPLVLSANFHNAEITAQPQDVTTTAGKTATFKVTATGNSLVYQWQLKRPGYDAWQDFAGYTASTLSFKVTNAYDCCQFRCKVTGSDGITVCSDAATLYINTGAAHYRALLISEVSFTPVCNRNEADVRMMKTMLQNVKGPEGGQYFITTKKDLTPSQIQSAIASAFGSATENDVSLFFIATHGDVKAGAGSVRAGELSTYNGDSVQFNELAAWLKEIPGKVIVFVESCGSGAAIYANDSATYAAPDEQAPVQTALDEQFAQALIDAFAELDEESSDFRAKSGELRVSNKFFVLTASALQQLSFGHEGTSADDSYNLFTTWLIEGVGASGSIPADVRCGNSDGIVTLEELYQYISSVGDSFPIHDDDGYIKYQTVKRYPEGSSYKLFKR